MASTVQEIELKHADILAAQFSTKEEKSNVVTELKSRGNTAYEQKRWEEAHFVYSAALDIDCTTFDTSYAIFGNRSAVNVKLGKGQQALEDANSALLIHPTWAKGFSRKGQALACLKRYRESTKAFEAALELKPKSKNLKKRLAKAKQTQIEEEKIEKNMQDNGKKETPKQEAEDKDDCSICLDALPKLSLNLIRLACCGKALHKKCADNLTSTTTAKRFKCPLCRGQYVKQDSEEEIERLHNWVKKGKAWAMDMLADRYRDGVGVKQSDTKAIELYEIAAKRGNASAQHNLGFFYEQKKDSKKAVAFYTLAAEQGLADSQYNLGLFYDEGRHGLRQSSKRAFELYTLASEQGHARAQSNLGLLYAKGEGVGKSNAKAKEWWTKAAAQGHEGAIGNLEMLTK